MDEAAWAMMKLLLFSYGKVILLALAVMISAFLMGKVWPTWEETSFFYIKRIWHRFGVLLGDEGHPQENPPPTTPTQEQPMPQSAPLPPLLTSNSDAASQSTTKVFDQSKCPKDDDISKCPKCQEMIDSKKCPHEKFTDLKKKDQRRFFSD